MQKKSLNRISIGLMTGAALVFVYFSGYFIILHNYFNAAISAFCGLTLFFPRLIYFHSLWRKFLSLRALNIIEIIEMFLLAFNGFGALGLYKTLFYYDMVLHTFTPFVVSFLLFLVIYSRSLKIGNIRLFRLVVMVFMLNSGVVMVWEGWEFLADTYFASHMFGQIGEKYDTLYDILSGLLAFFPALGIFYYLYLKNLIKWFNGY